MIANDKYNILSEHEQKKEFFYSSFNNYLSRIYSEKCFNKTYNFCKSVEYIERLNFIWSFMKNSNKKFIIVSTPCCDVELPDDDKEELICKTRRIHNEFTINNFDFLFSGATNNCYYVYQFVIASDFYGIRVAYKQ